MKQVRIKIPIYECTLDVILEKDLSRIAKKYKPDTNLDLKNFGAFTAKLEDKYRHYIMVLEDDWRSNIVHELVHVVNHIYLDCAMELDRNNDEPQAYLMGWLYHEIDKFLKK